MANPYAPVDLEVVRVLDDSLHIKWEVDNAVEFQPGIEYRVYQSVSGATWVLVQTVKRKEAVLKKVNDYTRTAVTSYTPKLGESARSLPIIISNPVTLSEDTLAQPIAIDEQGRARYLLTDPDGRLSIGIDNVNVEVSGMATEVKQDWIVAGIGDVNTELAAQHLSLVAFKDANHADLVAVESAVSQLNTDLSQLDANLLAFKAENNANLNDIESDVEQVNVDLLAFKAATDTNLNDIEADVEQVNADLAAFKAANHIDLTDINVKLQNNTTTLNNNLNLLRSENAAGLDDIKDAIGDASALNSSDIQDVEAAVTQLNTDNTAQNAALQSTVNDIKTNTDAILTELSVVNSSKILRSEAILTNVSPSGAIATLTWEKSSLVHQVTVIKEYGDAVNWTVEILNKALPITQRNVIYWEPSYSTYSPNRFDLLKTMPYINIDGNASILVRITPDAGTSNQFYVAVSGEKV
jgi:hypothetical protein